MIPLGARGMLSSRSVKIPSCLSRLSRATTAVSHGSVAEPAGDSSAPAAVSYANSAEPADAGSYRQLCLMLSLRLCSQR